MRGGTDRIPLKGGLTMPTSDLDLPLLPSAEQIRRREFATVRRGYDPDQVRDYLEAVATQVETLEKDLKQARLQLELKAAAPSVPMPAAPEADPYDRISKRFAGLIATADREASRIVEEAMTEADRIRVDAQANAEHTKQEGTEVLESARDEADRILTGLTARRELLVGQLQEMQTRLLGVAKDLEVAIEAPPTEGEDAGTIAIGSAESASPLEEAKEADAPPDAEARAGIAHEGPEAGDDAVDPRYDDLWVSTDASHPIAEDDVALADLLGSGEPAEPDDDEDAVDIPDLASIELDFDDDAAPSSD
jgi:DivIVA domain-containing protein